MSTRDLVAVVLLGLGVISYGVAALGQFLSRNAYNRLHAAAIANTITTVTVVAAVVVEKQISNAGIKALMIGLVFWVASPIVSHVTARSEHVDRTT